MDSRPGTLRRTLAPLLGITLAVSTTLSASGCGGTTACTLIGCEDGAIFELRSEAATIPPGAYELEVVTDAATETCAFDIGPGAGQPDCPRLLLSLGGSTLRMTVPGTPPQVELTLRRDGAAVLEETVALEYVETYPNGPECPPVCLQTLEERTFT